MRAASPLLTLSFREYSRRTLAGFFLRKWLRLPFILSSLPVPVLLNRAAAPLWVLSFGTLSLLRLCVLLTVRVSGRQYHRQKTPLESGSLLHHCVVDKVLGHQT